MQSLLAYRSAGRAVEEEHTRRKQRLNEKSNQKHQTQTRQPFSHHHISEISEEDSEKDVEKAESEDGPEGEEYEDDEGNPVHEGCFPTRSRYMSPDDQDAAEYAVHPSVYHHPPPVNQSEPGPLPPVIPSQTHSTSERRQLEREFTQGAALGYTMTGVNVRDRTTHEGKGQTNPKTGHPSSDLVFVVGFQGPKDPLNPHNWGFGKRISATAMIASIGFIVGFASSIDSSALTYAAAEFGVSTVTESLATGLYLIGFGVGALFAGPFSETLGRNPVYIFTVAMYMIFVMASGLAPNIGAQLVFRFIAGFFGATPLVCAGGSISDLWSSEERVFAFPLFAVSAFVGPIMGPVVGGFVVQSDILGNWRWTEWFTLIISGLVFVLVVLFQPETYPNTLLRWRAQHLRRVTGDCRYRAQVEVRSETFFKRLQKALYRPFVLTFQEPIIVLVAVYLTVVYIVLFTFLDGYTYIFADTYGTDEGITGLCFLGIAIGLVFATFLTPLIYKWSKRDLEKVKAAGGTQLPPEFRLRWAMLGGAIALPVSLFWMGWTARPDISLWSPLAASVLFGYGTLCIFISSYQYIIDSYEVYSASALASVTLIRYVAAGGMTVVGIPFYENLGVAYTLTILGCIAAIMVPVPYVFYAYGKRIRAKSKFAIAD